MGDTPTEMTQYEPQVSDAVGIAETLTPPPTKRPFTFRLAPLVMI